MNIISEVVKHTLLIKTLEQIKIINTVILCLFNNLTISTLIIVFTGIRTINQVISKEMLHINLDHQQAWQWHTGGHSSENERQKHQWNCDSKWVEGEPSNVNITLSSPHMIWFMSSTIKNKCRLDCWRRYMHLQYPVVKVLPECHIPNTARHTACEEPQWCHCLRHLPRVTRSNFESYSIN